MEDIGILCVASAVKEGALLLVQYGSTFEYGFSSDWPATDKSDRRVVLLASLGRGLVRLVPSEKSCATNSTSSVVLLCVSDDAPLAFHYEYAPACASRRPVALYVGGGAGFEGLCD